MANNCYFEMQITGRREAVEEFIRMISHKDEFKGNGLGRVFSFDLIDGEFRPEPEHPEFVSIRAQGDCAWSLKSALCDTKPRNLYVETKRLGIAVEAYSSEPGCCFQEHILMCCGSLIVNECVDYEEYWIECASPEERADYAKQLGITVEELMAGMDYNGDYTVGGFGDDFGNFEDAGYVLKDQLDEQRRDTMPPLQTQVAELLERTAKGLQNGELKLTPIEQPRVSALDEKIADANLRRAEPAVDGQEPEHIR